ncbi:MAG: hypothetical protein ACYTGH_07865, partial [Planctomycetota bacterium]
APPAPAATPEPAPAAAPAPAAISEEDLVKKELERKKAEREAKNKETRERIKRSARKPIKQGDSKKTLMIVGLIAIIGAAAGVVYYFLNQ